MRKLDPVTPGELLKEEFLEPMGITQCRLAKEIGVPAQRIGEIVAGNRSITAKLQNSSWQKLWRVPHYSVLSLNF